MMDFSGEHREPGTLQRPYDVANSVSGPRAHNTTRTATGCIIAAVFIIANPPGPTDTMYGSLAMVSKSVSINVREIETYSASRNPQPVKSSLESFGTNDQTVYSRITDLSTTAKAEVTARVTEFKPHKIGVYALLLIAAIVLVASFSTKKFSPIGSTAIIGLCAFGAYAFGKDGGSNQRRV